MTPGSELRKLKSEMTSFNCMNYEDLKFYARRISNHIRKISEHAPPNDPLLKNYIECVILKHVEIIDEFVAGISDYKGREEFVSKALKYHFNCIIDSYTYATLVQQ